MNQVFSSLFSKNETKKHILQFIFVAFMLSSENFLQLQLLLSQKYWSITVIVLALQQCSIYTSKLRVETSLSWIRLSASASFSFSGKLLLSSPRWYMYSPFPIYFGHVSRWMYRLFLLWQMQKALSNHCFATIPEFLQHLNIFINL